MGFVPVIHFKNRSAYRGYARADLDPVAQHIGRYHQAFCALDYELEKNKTRLFGRFDKKLAKQLKRNAMKNGRSIAEETADMFINVELDGDKSGDNGKNLMQIIQGNPKITEY